MCRLQCQAHQRRSYELFAVYRGGIVNVGRNLFIRLHRLRKRCASTRGNGIVLGVASWDITLDPSRCWVSGKEGQYIKILGDRRVMVTAEDATSSRWEDARSHGPLRDLHFRFDSGLQKPCQPHGCEANGERTERRNAPHQTLRARCGGDCRGRCI
jgi:hypothetical protein